MKESIYFIFYLYYEWSQCIERSLIKAFAQEVYPNRVLVINRPGDLIVSPLNRKVRRIDRLISSLPGKNLEYIADNLTLLRPFLFINDYIGSFVPGLNSVQKFWLRGLLNVTGLGPKDDERVITWIFSPKHWPFADTFPSECVIYQPVDEYTVAMDGRQNKRVIAEESKALAKSDIVFTLSDELAGKKSLLHGNVHCLGQGVDYQLFSKALDSHTLVPQELVNIPQPRIGMVGNIRAWIDFELVESLLKKRPDWSVVFIGRKDPSAEGLLDSLTKYPNFFWLGPKPYEDIYKWLAGFDVGIIPYHPTGVIQFAKPGKLYEYWAAGLPAVITRIGGYKPIENCLWVADSADEFIADVQEALAAHSPAQKEARLQVAKPFAWENVVRRALSLLQNVKLF